MTIYVHIFNNAHVTLWGLDTKTRLSAQLKKINGTQIVDEITNFTTIDRVLLIRGDYLYEDRVLQELISCTDSSCILAVEDGEDLLPVAAFVSGDMLQEAQDILQGKTGMDALTGARVITPETLLTPDFQEKLRKRQAPYVLPVVPEQKKFLEDTLYATSYKGVTDLVTKWLWPPFAKRAVHLCVHHKIRPNQVTLLSLVLVIIVTVLFYNAYFVSGLVLGWFMTFLDTVDGKLARVTLSSSKLGDVLDHGLDLVHPPVWYIAWGIGAGGPALEFVLGLIVLGYLGGRFAELLFELTIGKFGIFCWRPFDSCFRLVTARRNPNLILLTVSILLGLPYIGLLGVAVWTVLTTLVLLWRVVMALLYKKKYGFVRSWLSDIEQFEKSNPLAVKLFSHTTA